MGARNPQLDTVFVGQVFERLTVVELGLKDPKRNRLGRVECSCGNETFVQLSHLLAGNVVSCGCKRREKICGEGSVRWSGSSIGYFAAHRRVRVLHGKASDWECVDCGNSAEDWSYVGLDCLDGKTDKGLRYSPNTEYYEPRCRLCHKVFDQKEADGGKDRD